MELFHHSQNGDNLNPVTESGCQPTHNKEGNFYKEQNQDVDWACQE